MRILFILSLIMLFGIAWAANHTQGSTPSAPTASAAPATTQPANSQHTITINDAGGKPIGSIPNPEANTPLKLSDSTQANANTAPNAISTLIKIFFNLLLVMVIAYLALLIYRKYSKGDLRIALPGIQQVPALQSRLLSVVETISVGQGQSILLVSIGDRCFAVAKTMQQITFLCDVTDDAVIQEAIQLSKNNTRYEESNFMATLGQFLGQRKSHSPAETQETEQQFSSGGLSLGQFFSSRQQPPGRGKEKP